MVTLLKDYKHLYGEDFLVASKGKRSADGKSKQKIDASKASLVDYLRTYVMTENPMGLEFQLTAQMAMDFVVWTLTHGTFQNYSTVPEMPEIEAAIDFFLDAPLPESYGGPPDDASRTLTAYPAREQFLSTFYETWFKLNNISKLMSADVKQYVTNLSAFLTPTQQFAAAVVALKLLCDFKLTAEGRVASLKALLSAVDARKIYAAALLKRINVDVQQRMLSEGKSKPPKNLEPNDLLEFAKEQRLVAPNDGVDALNEVLETSFSAEEESVLKYVDVCIYAFDTYGTKDREESKKWFSGPRIQYAGESGGGSSAGVRTTGTELYRAIEQIVSVRYKPLYAASYLEFVGLGSLYDEDELVVTRDDGDVSMVGEEPRISSEVRRGAETAQPAHNRPHRA